LDLAGGTALIIHRLIVPLTVAVVTAHVGQACAQGAFRAPLSRECMSGFVPLREEAENRGKLIKAASARHAPLDETCKLIGNYSQAEIKMIRYVESNAATCGIAPPTSDQLKSGHKNTENMLQKVCAMARQVQQRGPSGPTGDFWTLPEKQL
jgi:hypothetical protein